MLHLPVDNVRIGSLEDVEGLTFVTPITRHRAKFVVGSVDKKPVAVFLDSQYQFHSMECAGARDWGGLLISNIEIEVDIESLCDLQREDAPIGSLIREKEFIAILAKPENAWSGRTLVVLKEGLERCSAGQRACFLRWKLVLRDKNQKLCLEDVDVSRAPD